MAHRVNLVDATAQVADRMAKTRSAVIRVGTVKAAPSSGLATLTVGGVDSSNFDGFDVLAGYLANYQPNVGDTVMVLNDRDKWLILCRSGDATSDTAPTLPWAVSAGRIGFGTVGPNTGTGATFTFPVGRFTQIPVIAVNVESSGYMFACTASMGVTGTTLRVYNPTAASPTSVFADFIAVQMSPTLGTDHLARQGVPAGFSTVNAICHTAECTNAEHLIAVLNEYPTIPVVCGVCSQPIDDLEVAS